MSTRVDQQYTNHHVTKDYFTKHATQLSVLFKSFF